MKKRLKLMKKLMNKESYICISIDANEQANLQLLCNEIFGENNFIACMPRRTKSSGKTTNKISANHDNILIYCISKENVAIGGLEHSDIGFRYEDEFIDIRGKYKLNQTLDYDSLQYSESLDYPLVIEGRTYYPGSSLENYQTRKLGNHKRADWAWRWSKDLFDFGYKNGFVVVKEKKDGSARIYTKTYLNATIKRIDGGYVIDNVSRTKPLSSLEFTEAAYSNDNAKKDFKKIFNEATFDYPKPVALIENLVRINPCSNITVLDCFAGTGTTAQAVLRLNSDGGKRKFILCTNNENNICRDITYERIKRVIFEENCEASLKYYRIDYVHINEKLYYEYADELLRHVCELVELENGINFADNTHFAIILTDEELASFVANINKFEACRTLYIGHDVLTNGEQEALLKNRHIKVNVIPDYYYQELEG